VLIGMVLCAITANIVYDHKMELVPYEAKSPVQFYAGMDKFLSNVGWMTLIQWEAKTDIDAPQAEILYNKLNSLTNLDPLFADAYLDGALSIMPRRPDLAAALLDKGVSLGLEKNWKLEFYSGIAELQYTHDPKKAEVHWAIARTLPNAPFYVETSWIRSRSDQLGNDRLGAMDLWYSFYNGLNSSDTNQRLERDIAAAYISDIGDQFVTDCDSKLSSVNDPTARAQLIGDRAKAQKMVDSVKTAPTSKPSEQPSA
jgi:hypothetical protein